MDIEHRISDEPLISRLSTDLQDVFTIARVEILRQPAPRGTRIGLGGRNKSQADASAEADQETVMFVGRLLRQDSETVYDLIAERWRAHNHTPLLRHYQGQIALIAQPGIVSPKPGNPWINLALALVTIVSVQFSGATYACQCVPDSLRDWLLGIPMMLAMMGILMAHEFGHYFAARYHRVAVTLPYFIPLPFISPVGTLGAVIQLRSPFKTKRQLFDIGIAGPLAGLILAVPLIFWGVADSTVNELTRGPNFVLEGNSIFYLFVKYFVHGQLLPNFDAYANLPFWQEFFLVLTGLIPAGGGTDILINSIAFAAWFGLFVTAMNLLPIGQLDGGHVSYCLLGDRARWMGMALIGLMVLAGIFLWAGWLLWALLTFFIIGPNHPPPLNDLVGLDPVRKTIAYVMIVLFIVLFMPNPLQVIS